MHDVFVRKEVTVVKEMIEWKIVFPQAPCTWNSLLFYDRRMPQNHKEREEYSDMLFCGFVCLFVRLLTHFAIRK